MKLIQVDRHTYGVGGAPKAHIWLSTYRRQLGGIYRNGVPGNAWCFTLHVFGWRCRFDVWRDI